MLPPGLRTIIFVVGCIWAFFGWISWPLTPHRGYMTALSNAIFLAPAYLLVSIRRQHGYAMRTFVVSAMVILILQGTRMVSGRIDLVKLYKWLPPIAAVCVCVGGLLLRHRKRHEEERHHCGWCEYALTGNVSGVCPECGTPIEKCFPENEHRFSDWKPGDPLPRTGATAPEK